MRMTIEESMKVLQEVPKVMPITKESINVALDTMHKYQKIQEIINNAKDSDGAVKYNWLYEQISGVMEDGTD